MARQTGTGSPILRTASPPGLSVVADRVAWELPWPTGAIGSKIGSER
jgi:hypothetical protein